VLILVTYDVCTESKAGRRRLRQVAKVCLNYGQRVQQSVFECRVDKMKAEALEKALLLIIDQKQDNLRFYRLLEPVGRYIKEYGCFKAVNFNETLIV